MSNLDRPLVYESKLSYVVMALLLRKPSAIPAKGEWGSASSYVNEEQHGYKSSAI